MTHSATGAEDQLPTSGPLEQFESEVSELDPPLFSTAGTSMEHRPARRLFVGALLFLGTMAIASGLWVRLSVIDAEPIMPLGGSLSVESDPESSDVTLDGVPRGRTPLTVSLLEGNHRLLVRRGGRTQELTVTVTRNVSTVHHISWPSAADVIDTATGRLHIVSDSAMASVSVDGIDRGSAPVMVDSLAPGEHDIVVLRSNATVQHYAVGVEPGATTSLVISATPREGLASGWLATTASVPLQVFERGQLVGTTESDRILLPVGKHAFEFVNDALGFRTSETILIAAGQTSSMAVDLPQGSMDVNAAPWAQVWLDGQPVGDTPIGNLPATAGSHELIFRHPQFGERHVTAFVTLKETARLAVDMTKADEVP